MIYPRLSLKNGGGIVSEQQQAEQDHSAVHILIGLGGTGIDCIAEIKKQVYTGIKPDDPEAEVPTYQHIQFLAVDADCRNDRLAEFESREFFDISNWDLMSALMKRRNIMNSCKEFEWMDRDKIGAVCDGDAGTGGFRVTGRCLLIDHSDLFLAHIEGMIENAGKKAGAKCIYIHVFSGLCGGLGSGCFLDVCYLIRQAIKKTEVYSRIFGHFFLPDTIVAKIPTSATWVRWHLEKNGYAAMQELDYCMRIKENGGAFTQNYKGGIQIKWDEPPVDFCHRVGNVDEKEHSGAEEYQKIIKKTALYIINCLVEEEPKNPFGHLSEFGNRSASMWAVDGCKEHGYHVWGYYTMGISCARVPMCEINTYLAAKTFDVFSTVKDHMPTEEEIERLAERAKVSSVSDLLMEITKNAGSDFAAAPDYLDWTYTRDNGEENLVKWYTDQKAERIRIQEKNANSMQDEKNTGSLIARICEEIDACAVDLNCGPAYAYNAMRAAYRGNLQNLVDDLLEELRSKISQLEYYVYEKPQSRLAMYEQSRDIWQSVKNRNGLFRKPQRAYNTYIMNMEDYIRGHIELDGMERLEGVLEKLKRQIESRATGYYQKFNRIMENLTETFTENLAILNTDSEKVGSYAIPLVTMDEICPKLDAAVKEMNMPGLFQQFVQGFFNEPEMWIEEDENKISKNVKKFFVNTFSQFANRSITEFLSEKYYTTLNMEITNHLYWEYLIKLTEDSKPLFPVDTSVWNSEMSGWDEYVSVPAASQVVIEAAQELEGRYPMRIKQSTFADCICIIQQRNGIPIGSYANTKRYEKSYFEEKLEKRHIYMGKGGSELFNNWNQLPPITPVSCIKGDIPREQQKLLDEAKTIYTEAKEMQLIYGDRIRQFTSDTVQKLEEMKALAANVDVGWEEKTKAVSRLRDVKGKLEASIKTEQLKYQDTKYSLPKGSIATDKIEETIREDYFVSSPALQTLVKRDLEKVNAVKAEIQKIEKRMELLGDDEKERRAFGQALLAGIIQWGEQKVSWTKTRFGISLEFVLSDVKDKERVPYASVPLYQAYISYRNLDTDTRENIQKETEMKIGAFDDDFVEHIKKYAEESIPEYMDEFKKNPEATPEILEKTKELIQSLKQELNSLYQAVKALGL